MKNSNFFYKLFLLIVLIAIGQTSLGQDVLHYYSGHTEYGDVIDVTDTEIILKVLNADSTEKALIIDKAQVIRIVYEGGNEVNFGKKSIKDLPKPVYIQPEIGYYSEISVNLVAPFQDYVEIGYETAIRENLGLEFGLGIIGMFDDSHEYKDIYFSANNLGETVMQGYSTYRSPSRGFALSVGPKLMLRNHNSMKGLYVKPEIFYVRITNHGEEFRAYQYSGNDYDYNWKFKGGSFGVMLNAGYPFLLSKRITLDISGGKGLSAKYGKAQTEGVVDSYYNRGNPMRYRTNWFNHLGYGLQTFHGEVNLGFLF